VAACQHARQFRGGVQHFLRHTTCPRVAFDCVYFQRSCNLFNLEHTSLLQEQVAAPTHFSILATCQTSTALRVEFLLKTDSGYPKDTGVTLFTLATPGNPLRYNTYQSAPPVSALTHSRGPRKRSQLPVSCTRT